MITEQDIDNLIDAAFRSGQVKVHLDQGHASQDEALEAAKTVVLAKAEIATKLKTWLEMLHNQQAELKRDSATGVFTAKEKLPAEDQPAGHEHDASCGHTAENTVRVGYILIESFIGEDDGNVLHMETHDGSHNPIQFDLAMMMMSEAAGMLLIEMFGGE
jgi:hypothetical protein